VLRMDGYREGIGVEERRVSRRDGCRGEMGVEEGKGKCRRECCSHKELVDCRGEWEIERIYIQVQ
jgi:hypothetical protein